MWSIRAEGSFRRKQPHEIVGSGYVVKTLEAALRAFRDAEDFRQAVLRALNLGDDADTTGAVCGQLAGAYWGESGIPVEWHDMAMRASVPNALNCPSRPRRAGNGRVWMVGVETGGRYAEERRARKDPRGPRANESRRGQ